MASRQDTGAEGDVLQLPGTQTAWQVRLSIPPVGDDARDLAFRAGVCRRLERAGELLKALQTLNLTLHSHASSLL